VSTRFDPPFLTDIAPDLAVELARELRNKGEAALADQVVALRMLSLCGGGDR
jgi:hypothetical protein